MLTISVIIPTHNRAGQVESAIRSVVAQTHPASEVIVVDDGSTDNTEGAVRSISSELPSLGTAIRYMRQDHAGPAVARNTGIHTAQADWVAFLDSDDVWLPQKLEWQAAAVLGLGHSVCTTDAVYSGNPNLTRTAFQMGGLHSTGITGTLQNFPRRIAVGTFHGVYLPTLLMRRRVAINLGGFDTALRLNEDTDFMFRLALREPIAYVARPLVMVSRPKSRSEGMIELSRNIPFALTSHEYMYEKWLRLSSDGDPNIRRQLLLRLKDIHARWWAWHLTNGERRKAMASLAVSLGFSLTLSGMLKWAATVVAPGPTRLIWRKRLQKKALLL
jgi:glycosyltransferase involved in cell wall biosynthesis